MMTLVPRAGRHNGLKKLRLPPHTALRSRVALSCVQVGQGRVWVLVGLGACAMKILTSRMTPNAMGRCSLGPVDPPGAEWYKWCHG